MVLFFSLACQVEKRSLEGIITNAQTFYTLEGSHNYPRIHFYGQLKNYSNSSINLDFENRAHSSSQLNQFIWVIEKDTLNLLCYNLNDDSEQQVDIDPDSIAQFGLRTNLLDFWNQERNEISDSTYYKKLLKGYSEKGTIYFIDNNGKLILMNRKSPFHIVEGFKTD